MESPKKGIYHHFKDASKEYEVIGIAFHTESEEDMVVYKPLYGTDKELFVRPLAMFMETVEKSGYEGPRFVFVREA